MSAPLGSGKAAGAQRRQGIRAIMLGLLSGFGLPVSWSARYLWKKGARDEIRFWDDWLRTKGSLWPEAYRAALDPDLVLQPKVAALLPHQPKVRILDVGSGPLTVLGKKLPDTEIDITAVDARADTWDRLLNKHGIRPVVRSQQLTAEKLTTRFAANTFDLVYARNSIDHCYDPERAVLQMIEVVKHGCYVLLEHAQNEGERHGWRGPHQCNLSMSASGAFIIASRHFLVDMTKYTGLCKIECALSGVPELWLITKIQKH